MGYFQRFGFSGDFVGVAVCPWSSAWISKTCVFLRVLDVHGNVNKKAECLHRENSVCGVVFSLAAVAGLDHCRGYNPLYAAPTYQVEASSFRQNHAISGLSILDSFLTNRSTST